MADTIQLIIHIYTLLFVTDTNSTNIFIQHHSFPLQTALLVWVDGNLQLCKKTHEAKVGKNPAKCNGETNKRSKLGKELELTEEERDGCDDTSNHSVENTNSQIRKRFSDSIVCVS